MGYFDLGCVEKSHSPAGKLNRLHENVDKNIVNVDKICQTWTQMWTQTWTPNVCVILIKSHMN